MRTIVAGLVLLAASVPMWAQGTYTQIDYPGGTATICRGINSAGDITCSDRSNNVWRGFLLSDGKYTDINYHGNEYTSLTGINDDGKIVGYSSFASFVYDVRSQTFTDVEYPGQTFTVLTSINNRGRMAGYYSSPTVSPQGFASDGLTYTRIVPKEATEGELYGITASGMVVGDVQMSVDYFTNFSFDRGIFHKIAIPGQHHAVVLGINNAGNILVGSYGNLGFAFLPDGNSSQLLVYPGALQTVCTGVNDSGKIVGYFYDAQGATHGFVWTPPATPV